MPASLTRRQRRREWHWGVEQHPTQAATAKAIATALCGVLGDWSNCEEVRGPNGELYVITVAVTLTPLTPAVSNA